jgi:ATP-binding cassette subfamily F protein uup
MPLLRLRNVGFSYGGPNIVEDISFEIQPGERIGLLGRNGAGKSTLMKLIEGDLRPDAGEIEREPALKISRLAQEVPRGTDHTVFDEVAGGLGEEGLLVAQIHDLSMQFAAAALPAVEAQLNEMQQSLNPETAWKLQQAIEGITARMSLDWSAKFESLSSGMRRRVLLARALVNRPDLLLLDEPTNHLDIEAIDWLEDFLLREGLTLVFVTHDRVFLQRLATRIIEVERARLFDWTCDYTTFQARKADALAAEARSEELFDKKLAEEEVWIRKGIEARRTRNEGRVRALERMREERRNRRTKTGTVRLQAQEAERSGNLVIDAQGVFVSFDGRAILRDISAAIYRGDKIGILGPNGSGKTTLLRVLLGEIEPSQGTVRRGTNLHVAYFDQLRAQLDDEKSAWENVAGGNDMVLVNGKSRHIMGYLQDFLFSGERARSLVRYLSGGERNRLLLARLFTVPSNVLILDEPTNDLDAETLELLEELLADYPGTLLLVSHDRAFLNHVVTSTLVFEGAGTVKEYAGGYDDWLRQKSAAATPASPEPARQEPRRVPRDRPRKLTYHEQRELESLPALIETLEAEQEQLQQRFAEPGFYQQSGAEIAKVTTRLETVHQELQLAYARWESLEAV